MFSYFSLFNFSDSDNQLLTLSTIQPSGFQDIVRESLIVFRSMKSFIETAQLQEEVRSNYQQEFNNISLDTVKLPVKLRKHSLRYSGHMNRQFAYKCRNNWASATSRLIYIIAFECYQAVKQYREPIFLLKAVW